MITVNIRLQTMNQKTITKKNSLAKSSYIVGSMTFISRISGFARDIIFANIFGAFGFLNGGEGTRINWASIHDINNEMGWSEAYPVLGIPDYVAVAASILVLIVAFMRK